MSMQTFTFFAFLSRFSGCIASGIGTYRDASPKWVNGMRVTSLILNIFGVLSLGITCLYYLRVRWQTHWEMGWLVGVFLLNAVSILGTALVLGQFTAVLSASARDIAADEAIFAFVLLSLLSETALSILGHWKGFRDRKWMRSGSGQDEETLVQRASKLGLSASKYSPILSQAPRVR